MQISVGTTRNLGQSLTMTIDGEVIKRALHKGLVDMAKKVHIDGFRKGKASLNIVEQRYGASVLSDTLNELMQQYFINAVVEKKLNLVGSPIYRRGEYEEGKHFTFDVEFELYPEVTINDSMQIEVEKPVAQILDSDVESMIERLCKQQGLWQVVEREARPHDRVLLDFSGTVDGKRFEGGEATDFVLVLGQGSMIPGFEEAILGREVGDSFNIDVVFPHDYHLAELKGKAARFASALKKVEELSIPPLTEDLIKRFGVKTGTLDGLKVEVRRNMERELESVIKQRIKDQIIDQLVSANKVDIPLVMLEHEVDLLHKKAVDRFKNNGNSAAAIPRTLFEAEAKKRIAVGLLFSKIIENHKIEVDDGHVKKLIDDIASTYQDPKEVISYYLNNKKSLDDLKSIVLEDQVINFLLEKAKVVEKTYSFSELMHQVPENS